MAINGNQWQSMASNGKQRQATASNGKQWNAIQLLAVLSILDQLPQLPTVGIIVFATNPTSLGMVPDDGLPT
jgi:hypothetical protein